MIKVDSLKYDDLTFGSKLMSDYYGKLNDLGDLYTHEPNLAGLEAASNNRKFDKSNRNVLHRTLVNQFSNLSLHDSQKANLDSLLEENSLTVTTGHQLCLFTGPLYSIYKIVSVIKLAKTLNEENSGNKYIPLFWLASEDHDFDEVNHAHIFGKKVIWNEPTEDAVGRMTLTNIEETIKDLFEIIGDSNNALDIKMLVSQAYSPDKTLTQATRLLIHELFKKHGLIILDADDQDLKKQFIPIFEKELSDNTYQELVDQTSEILIEKGYKKQVNPREINIFYLHKGLRRRIEKIDDAYVVDDSDKRHSQQDILNLLNDFPERFSPNAIMRPLYQEAILPNVAYIGGAGELRYWFQLKNGFDHFGLPFPTLLLRNSATIVDPSSQKKLDKLNVSVTDIFGDLEELLRIRVENNAGSKISLGREKSEMLKVFKEIIEKSKAVDHSLIQFAKAEKQRLENSVDVIEKKMLQAEKKNQDISLNQIRSIHEKLFPYGGLQERYNNVFQYFMDEGFEVVDFLIETFDPLNIDHLVFQIEKNK